MIQIEIKPTLEELPKDWNGSIEDTTVLDIKDGDTVTIPEGYVGELILEENETIEIHPIINGEDMALQMGYSVDDGDELEEGSYELKGNVIRKFLK